MHKIGCPKPVRDLVSSKCFNTAILQSRKQLRDLLWVTQLSFIAATNAKFCPVPLKIRVFMRKGL